jgi:hypothetical protein
VSEVLSEGVSESSRVKGYREGYSRNVTCLEMVYRGLVGQGESLEYEYSGRISQITRLKHAFSKKSRLYGMSAS